MRFKKLDMNLLAALDILIRTRSVSQSADEMCITQSAMSNALGRLRTFFDDPLLVQVGRRMELSPLAESLAGPVRDIIVRVESAVLLNPTFDAETSSREFSIVLSDYSLATIGPAIARLAATEAPGVRLNFRPQHTHPYQFLERGETDLVIAPAYLCPDTHPSETLFDDPLMVIACAEGPYAQGISHDAFAAAPHVMMEPNSGHQSYSAQVLDRLDITPRVLLSTYAFASIPDMIRRTDHIALVQGRLADIALRQGGIVAHEPPVDCPSLTQAMQWHRLRSRDPALAWLRAIIQRAANNASQK